MKKPNKIKKRKYLNEYDFDLFTSDSSDDHPKYSDGLEEKPFYIKQVDDYWVYEENFNKRVDKENKG